jgi:hypothetical protein
MPSGTGNRKEQRRRQREKYPERNAERLKKLRERDKEDREGHKERDRRWEAKHPGRSAERLRSFLEAHPHYARDRERRLAVENPDRLEEIRKKVRVWRMANPEKIREYRMSRSPEGVAKAREATSRWNKAHPEKVREYRRQRRETHPVECAMRRALTRMLKIASCPKTARCYQYIGCSPGFLRNHLESLFRPGMSWENYGKWHVDHIVPLSWWDIGNHPEHLFEASHYSNLQPMWARENRTKHNRRAG